MDSHYVWWAYTLLILLNVGIGSFVLIKNPKDFINQWFCLIPFSLSLWALTIFKLYNSSDVLFWGRLTFVGPVIMAYSFLRFSWEFPENNLTKNKYGAAAFIIFLAMLVISASPWIIEAVKVENGFPIPIQGLGHKIFAVYFIGFNSWGIITLVRKLAFTKGNQNNQIKYVLVGFFLTLVWGTTANLIGPLYQYFQLTMVGPFSTLVLVAFTAYAILKHRLMDISVVVSRVAAEIMATLFYGFGYLGLVFLYRSCFSTASTWPFLGGTILYGILVGIFYGKTRIFLQTTSDKLFLRGKYDYYQELAKISLEISRSITRKNILGTLRKTFYEVLEVAVPRIYLSGDFESAEVKRLLLFEKPTFIDDDLVIPCRIDERLMAVIVLGKKLTEEPYTKEDLNLLKVLANQTATALDHLQGHEAMIEAEEKLFMADKLAALAEGAAKLAQGSRELLEAMKRAVGSFKEKFAAREFFNVKDYQEEMIHNIDRLNGIVEGLMKRRTK